MLVATNIRDTSARRGEEPMSLTEHINHGAAELNRKALKDAGVFAVSLFGGPGCGKTTLIRETCTHLGGEVRIGVIVGNIRAERDAEMLRPWCDQLAVVETTDLTAELVREALTKLDLSRIDVLLIERGCGAAPMPRDLGQCATVGLFSVASGDDKVERYADRVADADVILLSKFDLEPYIRFDDTRFYAAAHRLNPTARLIELSCEGAREGLNDWCSWLRNNVRKTRASKASSNAANDASGEYFLG